MSLINAAKFTINSTPSEDPSTGDRKFVATNGQTLTLQLETQPSPGLSVLFEVYSSGDSSSPLASYGAPLITFTVSGTYQQQLTDLSSTTTIDMPASGVHSYIIRSTVSRDTGPQVFERIVAIESAYGNRKIIPAESIEYRARGWSDDIDLLTESEHDLISRIEPSTYNTVQDAQNFNASAGTIPNTYVADGGSETIDISAGSGYIKISNSHIAEVKFFDWSAASGVAIATGDTKYVGIEYNAGSPQYVLKATDIFNEHTEFRIARVTNEGGNIYITNVSNLAADCGAHTVHRLYETQPIQRADRLGGLIASDIGTRNIAVSAGELYEGLNEYIISAIDTSAADTFDAYYRKSGGGWNIQASQTQWNNTQYDDGSGTLQDLGVSKFGIHWIYLSCNGDLVTVYGQDNYLTIATAVAAGAPASVSDRILYHCKLIAKLIFQKSASSAEEVRSVFLTAIETAGVTNHNNLGALQGGTLAEYYHLTSSQHSNVVIFDEISATVSGTLTDWNPTGLADATHVVLTLTGNTILDSILAAGRNANVITIYNDSSVADGDILTVRDESASASATPANKIRLPAETSIAVDPRESVTLFYSATVSRWIIGSGY